MKITSFGLFWRRSEIVWRPGSGKRNEFRLLGRIGQKRGTLRVCDIRKQQGIYILYDEYGPCYTGLTRKQGLGKRLQDHTEDGLAECWDRFTWFGFNTMLKPDIRSGISPVSESEDEVTDSTYTTIADLEALLINVLGTKHNSSSMKFKTAERWVQIDRADIEKYLTRLKS